MVGGPDAQFGEVSAGHPRITRREAADMVTYEAAGAPIVVVRGATAEFRLLPEMVRAALRTPGTSPSERGPEWISFDTPAELERYDVDRLRSWFEMAARLAGG